MKKKIKDLTIGEIIEICRKCDDCKPDCPLRDVIGLPCGIIFDSMIDDLDQEVEV